MKSSMLLAAATLVVGMAVGYFVGASQSVETSNTETASTPAPTSAPPTDAASADRRAPSRRAATKESIDLSSIKIDVPPAPAGDGTITGLVVDADGKPLAGVLVRATPSGGLDVADGDEPRRARGSPPPPVDVERAVRQLVTRLRQEDAARRETTTDAAGAFTLTGLGYPTYDVSAWLVGWKVERTRGRSWEPTPVGGRCDFRATQIHALTASVLLPDGTPAQEATISWKPTAGGDGDSASWKPGSPEIEIAPGTYEITASANPASTGDSFKPPIRIRRSRRFRSADSDDDETLWRSEPQTVVVETGAAQTLTFQLKGRPGILVKVDYAAADHPSAVRIAAMKLDGGASQDPSRLLGDEHVRARWLTDSTEGAIAGLEPGTYLVGATFRGGIVGPTAVVSVGGDVVVQELRVSATDLRDWVKVWVRGPDGAPVSDATIECGCDGEHGSGSGEIETSPEADGSYRVAHYEHGGPDSYRSSSTSNDGPGLGKRTYYVKATSKRYGTAGTTYDPAKDREITIEMTAPALVRVTISGFSASPDRDRAVVVLEPIERGTGERFSDELEADIDAQGVAKFPPVRAGTYDVVLRLAKSASRSDKSNARWGGTVVARVRQTVAAGEASLTMALGALFELVVTFDRDAPSIERVGADGTGSFVDRARGVDGEKKTTYRNLTAGRYRLVGRAGEMFVDVNGDATVAFVPRPFNAFHFEVSEKGYVHDLGLKTGDLVIAIDGVEFTERASMDAALEASKSRETSKFTVLRGGQRFDVVADGKRLEEDDGSWYTPWAR
jgi:hypothetical protein